MIKKLYENVAFVRPIFRSPIFLICMAYTLSYGLLLIINGVFSDDWTVFNQKASTHIELMRQLGFFTQWPSYVHNFLLSLPCGIFFEKLLTFTAYLASALLLFGILKNIKEIDYGSKFFIVLFFSIFPVNFARIYILSLHYDICYALFFLGLYLIPRSLDNIPIRLLTLGIFFASFCTNSLLLFYIIALCYIVYLKKDSFDSCISLCKLFPKFFDFLILPVIFFTAKNIFFKPYGLYEGYNSISVTKMLIAPCMILQSVYGTFISCVDASFMFFFNHFALGILFVFSVFVYMRYIISIHIEPYHKNRELFFLLVGFLIFAAGIFPYIVVGKNPGTNHGTSHELLAPLGISFMLVYGIKIILKGFDVLNEKTILFSYALLTILFIGMNIFQYYDFNKDCLKQLSLIENFRNSDIIKNHTSFLLTDNFTRKHNIRKVGSHKFSFFEYTGLLKSALGDDTRFMCDIDFFTNIQNYEINTRYPQYNISNFHLKNPEYNVVISQGKCNLSLGNILRLFVFRYTNQSKYKEKFRSILSINYVPIGS